MGLFDLFAKDVKCPWCNDAIARQGLLGSIKCPNRGCSNFDESVRRMREEQQGNEALRATVGERAGQTYRNPRTGEHVVRESRQTAPREFDPGEYRLDIRYLNFQSERKTFTGDWRTLRRKNRRISLRVAPTGVCISLAADRIENISEVETILGRFPQPQERRIMRYHARRGTTSARFEELRRKYPSWPPNA